MSARACRTLLVLVAIMVTGGCGDDAGSRTPTSPSTPGPLGLTDQEFRDRLEALMLGSGPLSVRSDTGCSASVMTGWSDAVSTFTVLMSSKTTPPTRDSTMSVFEAFREIRGGRPALEQRIVNEIAPEQFGEITVDVVDDPATACGSRGAVACGGGTGLAKTSGHIILGITANVPSGHEAGHVIGMCHMMGGPDTSGTTIMLGAVSPTPLDLEILRRVYGAGLRPGSSRRDFVTVGLLR